MILTVEELMNNLKKFDPKMQVVFVDDFVGRCDGNYRISHADDFTIQEYGKDEKEGLFITIYNVKEYEDEDLE